MRNASNARLVALAFANDDGAVDRQLVHLAAHGVDGGLIGVLLVAAPAQPRRRHGGALGYADDLDRQDSIQRRRGLLRLRRTRRHLFNPPRVRPAPDWFSSSRYG